MSLRMHWLRLMVNRGSSFHGTYFSSYTEAQVSCYAISIEQLSTLYVTTMGQTTRRCRCLKSLFRHLHILRLTAATLGLSSSECQDSSPLTEPLMIYFWSHALVHRLSP